MTPPSQESRVKGTYIHHKEIKAASGIKIAAHNLGGAVAGTQASAAVRWGVAEPGDWGCLLWCRGGASRLHAEWPPAPPFPPPFLAATFGAAAALARGATAATAKRALTAGNCGGCCCLRE